MIEGISYILLLIENIGSYTVNKIKYRKRSIKNADQKLSAYKRKTDVLINNPVNQHEIQILAEALPLIANHLHQMENLILTMKNTSFQTSNISDVLLTY